nr:hypothetical protein [Tanacetum cinerariifolium]
MLAPIARGHDGDCGGDEPSRPPLRLIHTGCRGMGGCKPNKGGRRAEKLGTHDETRNLGLRKLMDEWGRRRSGLSLPIKARCFILVTTRLS